MKILLTGGTGGIGSAILKELSGDQKAEGVFLCANNHEQAKQLEASNPRLRGIQCRLEDEGELKRLSEELLSYEYNVLINNAFDRLQLKRFAELPWDEFQKKIDIGVRSAFVLSQMATRAMKQKGRNRD